MVQRCLFPPLSPPLSPAFGAAASSGASAAAAGGSPFARITHLPPPTAAQAAAARARAAALRQREARICGWVARLLWFGLHAAIISVTYAANAAVASRLRHDMPYTLSLAAMLAVNVALYVSLCALDPGYLPRTDVRLGCGPKQWAPQRSQQQSAIQLTPWRHPAAPANGGGSQSARSSDGSAAGHICCSPAAQLPGSSGTFLASQVSASPAPPSDDPGSLRGWGYAPVPAAAAAVEESQGNAAAEPHSEQQHSSCAEATAKLPQAQGAASVQSDALPRSVPLPPSRPGGQAAGGLGHLISVPAPDADAAELEEQALLSSPGAHSPRISEPLNRVP